jgi:hypothetical protein
VKRMMLTLAAASLAVAAVAAEMKSGLGPGMPVPAFDVVDVTGPNKGKQLCYRCSFGGNPVVAAFIKGNAPEAGDLVAGIDKVVAANPKLKSFVVFMGGPELKGQIEKLAAERKISVPLTFLPQGAKAADIARYQINPEASNTVLLWNKGAVRSNFVNVTPKSWDDVAKASADLVK